MVLSTPDVSGTKLKLFEVRQKKTGARTLPVLNRQRRLRTSSGGANGAISIEVRILENVLLLRNDRIFHAFTHAKFERGLGWNLDSLAGSRITAFARFAVRQYELSEAGQNKLIVCPDFSLSQIRQLFEKGLNVSALHAVFFGEVVDNFGLRHAFLACSRHGVV